MLSLHMENSYIYSKDICILIPFPFTLHTHTGKEPLENGQKPKRVES